MTSLASASRHHVTHLHSACDSCSQRASFSINLTISVSSFQCLLSATGGVDLDMGTDRDLDLASQPMSQATSGDMMGQDEDMQSGLLASWVIV